MLNQTESAVRYNRAALPRVHQMPTFADRMRQLRKSRGWTQPEAAKYFTEYMKTHRSDSDPKKHSYAPQHISDWERKTTPRGDTLEHLASFYNVSVAYLLGRTDDPSPEITDLKPQEIQLVSKLREHPDEASFIYRAYGIEPPARTLTSGDMSTGDETDK